VIGDADSVTPEPPSAEQGDQPIGGGAASATSQQHFVLSTTILQNLGANTAQNNLSTAELMLKATQRQIDLLRGRNDPDARDLIDFLEWLAKGLSELVSNLRSAVTQQGSGEPIFQGAAAKIAEDLYEGLMEAVKTHRVRIWEIAGIGAVYYLASLAGLDPVHLLEKLVKGRQAA
jgi:hypothetical protein